MKNTKLIESNSMTHINNLQDLIFQLNDEDNTGIRKSKSETDIKTTVDKTTHATVNLGKNITYGKQQGKRHVNQRVNPNNKTNGGQLMPSTTLSSQQFPLELHEMKNIQTCLFSTNQYMDNIYRYGIIHENRKQNISLYYSILFCIPIIKNFMILSKQEQLFAINKLKNKLYTDLTTKQLYTIHQYRKYGWTKTEIQKDIYESNNSPIVIQYLSDYFNINIFILNHNTNKLNVYYSESKFNKFKMNLLLAYKRIAWKDYFEPVIGSNKKTKKKYYLFNHTNNNLINLIFNKQSIECVNIHKTQKKEKTFVIEQDIHAIIKQVIESKQRTQPQA